MKIISAEEFWESELSALPRNEQEKRAVALMHEYADHVTERIQLRNKEIEMINSEAINLLSKLRNLFLHKPESTITEIIETWDEVNKFIEEQDK